MQSLLNYTGQQNLTFSKGFLTKFGFLITYSYVTTERRKFFILSGLSCAYYYDKNAYYEGHLTRLKVKTDCATQTFFYINSTHKTYT